MTVYVDDIRPTKPNRHWPYTTGCHMWADDTAELDLMADKLGLQLAYKQHAGDFNEHYDLTESKRKMAVSFYGAVPIPWRKMAELMQRKKERMRRERQIQDRHNHRRPSDPRYGLPEPGLCQ